MPIDNPDAGENQTSNGWVNDSRGIGYEYAFSPEGESEVYTFFVECQPGGEIRLRQKPNGDIELENVDENGNATKYVPGGTGNAIGKQ